VARQVSLSTFSAGGLVDPQMRESNDCYKGLSLLARLRLFLMAWMSPLLRAPFSPLRAETRLSSGKHRQIELVRPGASLIDLGNGVNSVNSCDVPPCASTRGAPTVHHTCFIQSV
jgi:hypothetical protein